MDVGNLSDPNEPRVHIEDPAATLICSKNLIWLAVVQISDIRTDHTGIQSLPTHLLSEPNFLIQVQLMCLVPVLPGQESNTGDWEWTGHFESLAGTISTFEISGAWIQLLNSTVLPPMQPNTDANLATYLFLSIELVATP